jgi:hypothetical protein
MQQKLGAFSPFPPSNIKISFGNEASSSASKGETNCDPQQNFECYVQYSLFWRGDNQDPFCNEAPI